MKGIQFITHSGLHRGGLTLLFSLVSRMESYKDLQISVINHGASSKSEIFMFETVFVEDLNGAINL